MKVEFELDGLCLLKGFKLGHPHRMILNVEEVKFFNDRVEIVQKSKSTILLSKHLIFLRVLK